MTPTRKQLGQTLKEARESKGLTLRAAAEQLGIHFAYLNKIESGQNALGKHAAAVAKLYGLNAAELEAMAGPTLPNLGPYLRAKYDLPDEAIAELEAHFAAVTKGAPKRRRRS